MIPLPKLIPTPPRYAPGWLRSLWRAYRVGPRPLCPFCPDSRAAALAVSVAPQGYQLRCVACSWRGPWFACLAGRLVILALDPLSDALQ